MEAKTKILITGAAGYIGHQLTEQLSGMADKNIEITASDIREYKWKTTHHPVTFFKADLCTNEIADLILKVKPDVVVHLAAIVDPPRGMTANRMHDIEVGGTKRILEACSKAGTQKVIITSSGAAYGYYANNPQWLKETDPLRGNEEMPYPYHKRLVEEMLAEYQQQHPELKQLIFRVSTILGEKTNNQITAMFHKKNIMGVMGTETPFVIIWDKDLVAILTQGIFSEKSGIYNVAGDGYITLKEMAVLMKKKFIQLPPHIIKYGIKILKAFGATRYEPEQVKFVQYRPVLDNAKLKSEFGYTPQKSSKEVFVYYAMKNGLIGN